MTSDLAPQRLAEIALGVAREAATLVQAGWRTRPDASEKGRADLVTQYDLASEALIVERLRALTPDIPVVAEERGGEQRAEPTWYCDPLDGTTNFVHGHPCWSISIGLVEKGKPVAGAVVAPCLGTYWTAYRGGPALRNGEPCRVSPTQSLSGALLATGFPAGYPDDPHNNVSTFAAFKRYVHGVRRCGSAAIDLCMVADGTYDGYWERGLCAWDLAAGTCAVLSAGGQVSHLDGADLVLERGHVVASNGALHGALLEVLSAHLA